jgi:hemolysin activation/secretion protein
VKVKQEEAEEEEETEEEETEEEIVKPKPKAAVLLVVKELPKQDVRQVKLEDGNIATLITVEEAMTEMFNIVKKLEKGLL